MFGKWDGNDGKCVLAHINHIRRTAGVDNVGLGAGYDGLTKYVS